MVTCVVCFIVFFFFSSRRRHTRCGRDWSSDVCSSDLVVRGRAVVLQQGNQLLMECAGIAAGLLDTVAHGGAQAQQLRPGRLQQVIARPYMPRNTCRPGWASRLL